MFSPRSGVTQEQRASIICTHKQENRPRRHQMYEERRSAEVRAGEERRTERTKKTTGSQISFTGGERRRCWGVIGDFLFLFFHFLQGKLTYGGSRFSHTGWGALILDCAVSRPDTRQERARKSFFCLCAVKWPHKQHCAVFTGKVKKNHQGDFSCKPPGSFDSHAVLSCYSWGKGWQTIIYWHYLFWET